MLPPLHGRGYPAGPRAPTSVGLAVRGRGAESPPRVVFGGAARLDSEADAGRHSRPTPSILITITVRALSRGTPPATYCRRASGNRSWGLLGGPAVEPKWEQDREAWGRQRYALPRGRPGRLP